VPPSTMTAVLFSGPVPTFLCMMPLSDDSEIRMQGKLNIQRKGTSGYKPRGCLRIGAVGQHGIPRRGAVCARRRVERRRRQVQTAQRPGGGRSNRIGVVVVFGGKRGGDDPGGVVGIRIHCNSHGFFRNARDCEIVVWEVYRLERHCRGCSSIQSGYQIPLKIFVIMLHWAGRCDILQNNYWNKSHVHKKKSLSHRNAEDQD
jgi:hypothetical protein